MRARVCVCMCVCFKYNLLPFYSNDYPKTVN